MTQLTLKDIDTAKTAELAMVLVSPQEDRSRHGATLYLTAEDCHHFFTWLKNNKHWRGAGNKAIRQMPLITPEDLIELKFDWYTFNRMQDVQTRSITDEQFAVLRKIYAWQVAMCAPGESLVAQRRSLQARGPTLNTTFGFRPQLKPAIYRRSYE